MTALYTATGAPVAQVRGTSASLRNEFLLIQAGFASLPVSAYAVDTGAVNAYAVTVAATVNAYTDGLQVILKASHANTGASTVNVNGLGAIAIVHQDGTALQVNDIYANQFVVAIYNATLGEFVLAGAAMGQILADITAQVSSAVTAAAFQTALPGQSSATAGLFPQSQGASGLVVWSPVNGASLNLNSNFGGF